MWVTLSAIFDIVLTFFLGIDHLLLCISFSWVFIGLNSPIVMQIKQNDLKKIMGRFFRNLCCIFAKLS